MGFTKRGRVVSAKIEVDLSQPLKRGNWLLNAAKQKVWIRYHFEKQPRKICPDCFTIDHNQEMCEERAWNIFIFGMTEAEFGEYYVNHAHLVEAMQNNPDGMEGENGSDNQNGPEDPIDEETDPRKHKRSRDSGMEDNYVLLEMNSENPNQNLREISQSNINGRGVQLEIGGPSHEGYDLNMEDADNGVREPNPLMYHLPAAESTISTSNQP
ncbi:hypothetical protein C5167_047586 [Papaver somniferum]|uniref:Zinc knuckle CX2CX4HX4C domain-containing protein n=1 Tax=Papaver somniferum TaxID=3469 RepID=A0A4Y7LIL5_PAPSO|nr:hypothetical protein C5167_047586 [Papaver somniferum]